MRRTGWPGQGLGMVPCGRRSGLAAWGTAAALCLGASATADVTGLEAEHWIKTIGGVDYHVADVYARCENEGDKLLLVWNTVIVLSAAPNATFFNAPLPGGIETARPVCWDELWDPTWQVDTYFGLGGEQCDTSGFVALTPDTPSTIFVGSGEVATSGGWFNVPPTMPIQTAGPDLRVRLARLSVNEEDWTEGASVAVSWTIAWLPRSVPGSTTWSSFSSWFGLPANAADGPEVDLPGDPTPPGGGGGGGGGAGGGNSYVPPEPIGPIESAEALWLSPNGFITAWQMDGFDVVEKRCAEEPSPFYLLPRGHGDLDGDGDQDFVFLDFTNNSVHAWHMENGTIAEASVIGTIPYPVQSQWKIIGVGDVSGDGRADVLWRREDGGNRPVRVWVMDADGVDVDYQLGITPGYEFLGTGDLNGDGLCDFLWRAPTGHVLAWHVLPGLSKETLQIGAAPPIGSAWKVRAIADLDGDGDGDVVWHNAASAQVNGWLLQGFARVAGGAIAYGVPFAYSIVATPDLDGDGDHDLLWRSSDTGMLSAWRMTGLAKEAGGVVGVLSTEWQGW